MMRNLLEQLAQDIRYGVRGLRRSRSFLFTTVATLAVGVGLLAVAFTVVNAYVLRPYAVRDPQQLHQIGWRSRDDGGQSFRWREYQELRDRADVFDAAVAESTRFVSSKGRPLAAALVSDNYFEALGPAVFVGRTWRADERDLDGVVLSHQAWTRLFTSDGTAQLPGEIDINGRPLPVLGVLRPEFVGLSDSPRDVWMPFRTYAATANPSLIGADQPQAVEVFVRLKPGVTAPQAQAALTPFMTRVVPRGESVRADVAQRATPNPLSLEMAAVLAPVFAAFGLVLVAACANVSNVMLARAAARHREIAVRLSLGASRGRLVRQLLTEGLLIAILAGVAGVTLAAWMLRGGTAAFSSTLPPSVAEILRPAPLDIDSRVFLFCLAVSALAPLLFALLPALQASRLTLMDVLRGHGAESMRGSRLRGLLVTSQVAIGTVLVILAVTLARNGAALAGMDLGYETAGVLSINVRGEDATAAGRLADVLNADPRVESIAVSTGNPLFVRSRDVAASPDDRRALHGTRYTFITPEYFALLRIPIERGRSFRQDEASTSARVAIVSAAAAREFWPNQDPIGKTLRIEPPEGRPVEELPGYSAVTVVGVARDAVSGFVMDGRDRGHIYLPADAHSEHLSALLVRGRTPDALTPEVLDSLFRKVASDPQLFEALPVDELRVLQVYPLRAASWMGALLALVAVALSVAGLYGVLSFTIGQRTREIGIRMALGASATGVVGLVVRYAMRFAGAGAAFGLLAAFLALSLLGTAIRIREISVVDGASFAAALAVIVLATVLAAYQPARRATRVNPAQALRAE